MAFGLSGDTDRSSMIGGDGTYCVMNAN